MVSVKKYGELVLVNTKMITYISTEVDYRYPNAKYRLNIKFVADKDLDLSFSTEKEREDFINEILNDMNGSK